MMTNGTVAELKAWREETDDAALEERAEDRGAEKERRRIAERFIHGPKDAISEWGPMIAVMVGAGCAIAGFVVAAFAWLP